MVDGVRGVLRVRLYAMFLIICLVRGSNGEDLRYKLSITNTFLFEFAGHQECRSWSRGLGIKLEMLR